jgi:hypothetical protein
MLVTQFKYVLVRVHHAKILIHAATHVVIVYPIRDVNGVMVNVMR